MISPEILEKIKEEVAKDVQPLWEEDPLTAECDEEYDRDYKEAQCLLLDWLRESFPTDSVLYAGSGSDIFPKLIFGEEKVVHTSYEHYNPNDEFDYFLELGNGLKVVADNVELPFPDSSFDMVLLFSLFTNSTREQLAEAKRVTKEGGLIVCDNVISDNIDLTIILSDYIEIEVPSDFQDRGISETYFSIYKKVI